MVKCMACQVVCTQLHRTQTKGTEESPKGQKCVDLILGRVEVRAALYRLLDRV